MMRYIPRLAAALLAAAFVLFSLAFWISPHLQEEGDLAANALQVERAREFGELLGPYSHYGFHHLGPISFYYFAAAQSVLWFLPAILARHMLAQYLLNLLCLAGILRLLRKSGLEPPLIAAGGFLLAAQLVWLGGGNPLQLASVWGPLVVTFPVIFFMLAVTRLARGELAWLPSAILAATVAIHNHLPTANALAAAVVVGVVMLVRNRRQVAWTPGGSRRWILLAGSLLLVDLAVLPALIEQSRTGPGNLSLLWEFFRETGPGIHPWAEVVDKLGQAVTDPLVVLGGWTGFNFHSPVVVLVSLAMLLAASILQIRRSENAWRGVILITWVTLAAAVVSARTAPGSLHTYLFYYLYPLVGLLQVFLFKEVHDRWIEPHLTSRWRARAPAVVSLAGALFFLPWLATHPTEPAVPFTRYTEIVEHFGLAEVRDIHLFVDRKVENDQVWFVLPTLALEFRRDGVRTTVPPEYVFLCGEEMRTDSPAHPLTLVITRRVPATDDDRYLPGPGWGVFLLENDAGDPAEFLSALPWME